VEKLETGIITPLFIGNQEVEWHSTVSDEKSIIYV
jgi:hypothetical protein